MVPSEFGHIPEYREVAGTPSSDPVSPGTLPVSEYSLPIYESLPVDHFETPRHVRDLIRDSEQTSEHQIT